MIMRLHGELFLCVCDIFYSPYGQISPLPPRTAIIHWLAVDLFPIGVLVSPPLR